MKKLVAWFLAAVLLAVTFAEVAQAHGHGRGRGKGRMRAHLFHRHR